MSIDIKHINSLILIAGISGAGKSSVLHALADLGYYIIENLPLPLFKNFLVLSAESPEKFKRTALLLDISSVSDEALLAKTIKDVKSVGSGLEFFFVDCNTPTLIKRYSETRRPHPGFNAATDRGLNDTIARERERLAPFKDVATFIIDTTEMSIHDLRRKIKSFVDSIDVVSSTGLRVNFVSFGFKKGLPNDCDIVMDVRFLPNPYFIEELRGHNGLDSDVKEYVNSQPATQEFVDNFSKLLKMLLPQYAFEGKSYLNIGIGCTGGRHRSVAVVEMLAENFKDSPYLISVQHRELDR